MNRFVKRLCWSLFCGLLAVAIFGIASLLTMPEEELKYRVGWLTLIFLIKAMESWHYYDVEDDVSKQRARKWRWFWYRLTHKVPPPQLVECQVEVFPLDPTPGIPARDVH
ncbi:MAG: hypothetical protein KGJ06_00605 [Pseudomonadota bacterium]|nr:hypothetical protein [Pseudomonadota bacterium]